MQDFATLHCMGIMSLKKKVQARGETWMDIITCFQKKKAPMFVGI